MWLATVCWAAVCLAMPSALALSRLRADDETAVQPQPTLHDKASVLGFTPQSLAAEGKLVIVGGGEATEEINDEFMRLAGGENARVVLIPAFPYETPEEVQELIEDWKKYSMASITILDAKSREEADTLDFVLPLKKATGVWLCGGVQAHLANLYNGTRTEIELRKVLDRGGVIGGTSAGASFMSRVMIHDGTHKNADLADGLGLVQRAVIDQHFTQRGRHTRLIGVLDDHPELIGIGVDENTALVVRGNHLRVIGESKVTIFLTPDEDEAVKIYRLKHDEEARLEFVATDVQFNTPRIQMRRVRN